MPVAAGKTDSSDILPGVGKKKKKFVVKRAITPRDNATLEIPGTEFHASRSGMSSVVTTARTHEGGDHSAGFYGVGSQDVSMDQGPKKKRVVVARRIQPGQTLHLGDGDEEVRLPSPTSSVASDDDLIQGVPASLALGTVKQGPRADEHGRVVAHSVLGDPDEYVGMVRERTGGQPTEVHVDVPARPLPGRDLAPATASTSGNLLTGTNRMTVGPDGLFSAQMSERSMREQATVNAEQARAQAQAEEIERVSRMQIHEKVDMTREERALARWEAANKEWDKFRRRQAKRTGRDPDHLVFSRAEEHRSLVEDQERMQGAISQEEKFGSDAWQMGLRGGDGVRYVRLGNAASGLYVPIKEIKREREVVRRPNQKRAQAKAVGDSAGPPQPRYLKSEYFQTKKARLLAEKEGGEEEDYDPDYDFLEVRGHQMVPDGIHTEVVPRDAVTFTPFRPNPITVHNNDEKTAYKTISKNESMLSLASFASKEPEQKPGPSLKLLGTQLVFDASTGVESSQRFPVLNDGATAVFFKWRKVPRPKLLETHDDYEQRFFLHDMEGAILPGDQVGFDFSFRSETPGIFTESWVMETRPPITPEVTLQIKAYCVQTDYDENERQHVDARLHEMEVLHNVHEILVNDVLRKVKTPTPPPKPVIPLKVEELLFNSQNRDLRVFFYPEYFDAMRVMYDQALEALLLQYQQEAEAAASGGKKKGGGASARGGGGGKKSARDKKAEEDADANADPPPDPATLVPKAWDLSVVSLHSLINLLTDNIPLRKELLIRLMNVLNLACEPPADLPVSEAFAHHLVHDALGGIGPTSERIRSELELPEQEHTIPPPGLPMPLPATTTTAAAAAAASGDDGDEAAAQAAAAQATYQARLADAQRTLPEAGTLAAQREEDELQWSGDRVAAEEEYLSQLHEAVSTALQKVADQIESIASGTDAQRQEYAAARDIYIIPQRGEYELLPQHVIPDYEPPKKGSKTPKGKKKAEPEPEPEVDPDAPPKLAPRLPWDPVAELAALDELDTKKGKKGKNTKR